MLPSRVIRSHAAAATVIAATWLAVAYILSWFPSVPFRAFTLTLIAIGSLAVLVSVFSLVAYTRSRRSEGAASGGVLFGISAVCLIISWGSAVAGWAEEYWAGMSLPIINLFFLLVPPALVLALVAAWGTGRPSPSSGQP